MAEETTIFEWTLSAPNITGRANTYRLARPSPILAIKPQKTPYRGDECAIDVTVEISEIGSGSDRSLVTVWMDADPFGNSERKMMRKEEVRTELLKSRSVIESVVLDAMACWRIEFLCFGPSWPIFSDRKAGAK